MSPSQAEEISVLRKDIEGQIETIEKRILEDQHTLQSLKLRLKELIIQEKERACYLSSSEILDLIYEHTGKESNMSTIKRWSDQGFLGEAIDEREVFWALKSKQGKKRFVYPKKQVYQFLYDKKLIRPRFEVLDRVKICKPGTPYHEETAVVITSRLAADEFLYTLQMEKDFLVLEDITESYLSLI